MVEGRGSRRPKLLSWDNILIRTEMLIYLPFERGTDNSRRTPSIGTFDNILILPPAATYHHRHSCAGNIN